MAKKEKPSKAKASKPKQKNEFLTFGLVPMGVVILATVIGAAASVFYLQAKVTAEHGQRMADTIAGAIAFQINQRETMLRRQIESAGNSVRLSELVMIGSEDERAQEERRLRELVPGAIRVRIFKPGTARREPNSIPPFSFTSLDMVNRVEIGDTVQTEAINYNNGWVLSIAAPIRSPSDTTVRGVLFVYLNVSALSDDLENLVDGEAMLLQQFGTNEPQPVFSTGTRPANDVMVEMDLDNANWRLRFRPSDSIVSSGVATLPDFLVPVLILALLALVAVFFGIRTTLKRIGQDVTLLENQIADVISGDYQHSDKYTLRSFVDLDFNLLRLGPRERQRPTAEPVEAALQPSAAPAPPRAENEKPRVEIEMADEPAAPAVEATEVAPAPAAEPASEEPAPEVAAPAPAPSAPPAAEIDRGIFRAYDIRGVVGESVTVDVARLIGQAIGTEAGELGEQLLIVGYDGRNSSPALAAALIEGLTSSGRDVINIGSVPTPVVYFATHNSDSRSGVVVTASHNPAEYNGFKIVLDGRTLVEEDIARLYHRIVEGDLATGAGESTEIDITADYIDAIADDVVVAQPLRVVMDCGNGVGGLVAPDLFEALGCEIVPLHCEVDGNFPNHDPDPIVPANLSDLLLMVRSEEADLGIAIDGDGDRMVAVTRQGDIIWPDRLMMLFAKDVVSRNPGTDVVYDVKSTRHLNTIISNFGGRPVISRSGHSYVKAKMAETGAVLGGEMSGHICFAERWFGFDDGLYAAARLLEIVGSQSEDLATLMAEFPNSMSTPELKISVPDDYKFEVMDRLRQGEAFPDGTATLIDGLRVDFADGWGLVRASNTSPSLTLRFEADNRESLDRIQDLFRERLHAVNAELDF